MTRTDLSLIAVSAYVAGYLTGTAIERFTHRKELDHLSQMYGKIVEELSKEAAEGIHMVSDACAATIGG